MNKRAQRYFEGQKPENPENHARMLKVFMRAKTHDELRAIGTVYIFDMDYSRADICHVLGVVERERGWV